MKRGIELAAFILPSSVFERVGLFLCCSCLWLTACAGRPNSVDSSPPKLYTLRGTVLSLHPEDHTTTIKGEAIPGWMGAITMDYPVKEAKDWQVLRPNEAIRATVEVQDMDYKASQCETGRSIATEVVRSGYENHTT